MRRREFIAALGGAAAWPVAVHAQHAKPIPLVAVLAGMPEHDPEFQSWVNALKQGLAALGWTHGHERPNDVWSGYGMEQKFVKEFVDLHPNVIVAIGTFPLKMMLRETHSIPIVFTQVTDPVGQG